MKCYSGTFEITVFVCCDDCQSAPLWGLENGITENKTYRPKQKNVLQRGLSAFPLPVSPRLEYLFNVLAELYRPGAVKCLEGNI